MAKWKCDACGEAENTEASCIVEMWAGEPECCPITGEECEWYLERINDMKTKGERIDELLVIISNKSGRIKKLKLECGQQSTQICVLNLRIKELYAGVIQLNADCNKAQIEAAERIKELGDYLIEFGHHKKGCIANILGTGEHCNCGFEQALKPRT